MLGEHNPADALSKVKHNGVLGRLLARGIDDTSIEERIVPTVANDLSAEVSCGRTSNDEESGECDNLGLSNGLRRLNCASQAK